MATIACLFSYILFLKKRMSRRKEECKKKERAEVLVNRVKATVGVDCDSFATAAMRLVHGPHLAAHRSHACAYASPASSFVALHSLSLPDAKFFKPSSDAASRFLF